MSKRRSKKSMSLLGLRIEDARRSTARRLSGRPPAAPPGTDFQSLEPRLLLSASVGNRVWEDMNGNGIQDPREPDVAGVTVNLLDSGGNVVDTTTTDAGGAYGFTVAAGSYIVEFVLPDDYGFSPQGAGTDPTLNSKADPTTGRTAVFTLVDGQTDLDEDAGMSQAATIGDFVWDDTNGNGIQDAGEPGLADVTVNLLDGDGNVVNTTTTDSNGNYLFETDPGTYVVEFVPLPDYSLSPQGAGTDPTLNSKADPVTGQTAEITLVSGQTDLDQDAGMSQAASIGDFVWDDTNGNGIQDAGEPGLANVTVNLLDGTGTVVNTTTTDSNGNYLFETDPGTYVVEFVPLDGYAFSPQGAGTDPTLDSKADPVTGQTAAITLVSGQQDLDEDAGLSQAATVGDFVWNDLNGNGIQDAGEPGLEDVTVNLLDSTGAVVNTTTTDSNGNYSFQIDPGTYTVEFIPLTHYKFSPQGAGTDPTLNSKADPETGRTAELTFISGQQDLDQDAGMIQTLPVHFGAGGATRVQYTDTDGTTVKLTLTGAGSADLFFDENVTTSTRLGTTYVTGSDDSDGQVELSEVDLAGTKAASSLSVTTDTKGDRAAQIGVIQGSSPLGKLTATTTDLTGDGIAMTGAGYIGNVSVRNLLNGADIEMAGTGPATPWASETIKAGVLGAGSDIDVAQTLGSLTVVDWASGQLSAPRASSIQVTGMRGGAVGNMGAGVSLTGSDTTSGYSLGTLKVAGDLTSVMNLAGSAKSVTAGRWSAGSFNAQTLDNVTVSGNKTAALAGDLRASITLAGASSTGYSCQSISVAGAVQNTTISMAGSAGSLTTKQMISSQLLVGFTPDDPLNPMAGGTFDTQSIRSVSVTGVAGSVAGAFTGSTIAASQVGSVSLASFDSNNLGTEFGVLGQTIGSVTSRAPSFRWNKAGAADQGVGDFHVLLEA